MQFILYILFLAPAFVTIELTSQATQTGIHFELGGQLRLHCSNWRVLISLTDSHNSIYKPSIANVSGKIYCGFRLSQNHSSLLLGNDIIELRFRISTNIDNQIQQIKINWGGKAPCSLRSPTPFSVKTIFLMLLILFFN